MSQTFCLAHLSDPHLTSLHAVHPRELLNKRLLGYLSWQLHRRHEHRFEVLEALVQDLQARRPDHTVITGDLTQLGLGQEYRQAADWLAHLGAPEQVTVIPGNHDRYVATSWENSLAHWTPYLVSDAAAGAFLFPSLRRRGPAVIIGVHSAPPSAPFVATGTVGKSQLARLSALLESCTDPNLCRIVLIHHPPHPEAVKRRKRLTDAAALHEILAKWGCGLILHGHSHQWQLHWLKGPKTPIPVLGVPSASAWGLKRGYRARYHLCYLGRRACGFEIRVEIRGFCQSTWRFRHEGRFHLEVAG